MNTEKTTDSLFVTMWKARKPIDKLTAGRAWAVSLGASDSKLKEIEAMIRAEQQNIARRKHRRKLIKKGIIKPYQ